MKKSWKIYTFVLLAFFSTSCAGWLDLAPEDGVIREEYWKTKEHVNSAVVGCYASLLGGNVEKMFLWGELRADMVENGIILNNSYVEVMDGEMSSSNPVVNWASFYSTINNCNTVLRFAPEVRDIDGTFTQKMLSEYEAEALTIRAMMYFYLVRSFRDVPLVLEASISDDQNYSIAKTSGDVILEQLVSDLKIASANAPITYSSLKKNKSRVTAWTAKALLADIYLWQEKYAECNALCQEIIASGRFSLIPVEKMDFEIVEGVEVVDTVKIASDGDAENMFNETYVKGNSIESLFEIPFTTVSNNPFYSLLGPTSNRLRAKLDIVDGIIFPEPQYEQARSATDIRGSGCSFRIGLVWKYVGTSRSGAPRAATDYTSPWIVYKYSDVLLMKAEALAQMGLKTTGNDSQRNNYYNQAIAAMTEVREARNAVKTSGYIFEEDIDGKMLEKAILEERAREFAYEGKRWYDVLRNAKRGDYEGNNLQYLLNLAINSASPQKQQSLIAKYKDPKRNSHYWPIYIHELETNKNLEQNEFYAQ